MQVNDYYLKCKIEVETFGFDYSEGVYNCEAITPGVPLEIEPTAFTKTVTIDELEAHVAPNHFVTVTNPYNSQESENVPYWRWSADMRDNNRVELMDIFAEIINKREGRAHEWSPKCDILYSLRDDVFNDTYTSIQSIVKPNAA